MAASKPTAGGGQARKRPRGKVGARQGVRRKRVGAEAENREIGRRVREFREERKLTQREFGIRLGVGRAAVGHWERGRGIQRQICQEIARVYGASLEWLLMGDGLPRPIMPGSLEEYMAGLPAEIRSSLDLHFRVMIDGQHSMLGIKVPRESGTPKK